MQTLSGLDRLYGRYTDINAMGMDTVLLGAGDIEGAHQANEFVPLDRIEPMQGVVSQMIQHFCT